MGVAECPCRPRIVADGDGPRAHNPCPFRGIAHGPADFDDKNPPLLDPGSYLGGADHRTNAHAGSLHLRGRVSLQVVGRRKRGERRGLPARPGLDSLCLSTTCYPDQVLGLVEN